MCFPFYLNFPLLFYHSLLVASFCFFLLFTFSLFPFRSLIVSSIFFCLSFIIFFYPLISFYFPTPISSPWSSFSLLLLFFLLSFHLFFFISSPASALSQSLLPLCRSALSFFTSFPFFYLSSSLRSWRSVLFLFTIPLLLNSFFLRLPIYHSFSPLLLSLCLSIHFLFSLLLRSILSIRAFASPPPFPRLHPTPPLPRGPPRHLSLPRATLHQQEGRATRRARTETAFAALQSVAGKACKGAAGRPGQSGIERYSPVVTPSVIARGRIMSTTKSENK